MERNVKSRRPRIGISANTMKPVWDRRFYIGKALQYAEESMIDVVWRNGGLPVMLPMLDPPDWDEIVGSIDGLLLSGGEDVSPTLYGETARRPEWAGNVARDRFEIGLVEAFAAGEKPVLGICRGHQVINVAMGGSLYQDLQEDGVVVEAHRDPAVYCRLHHAIAIRRPSYLFDLYGVDRGQINTVHHQAIRDLGGDLEVLADSHDGLIEAVRHTSADYIVGVQWHPEWIGPEDEANGLLSADPLLQDFISRAAEKAA